MESERPRPDENLTRAILARTSGPTCGAARDLLPAFAAREIDPFEGELVRVHLTGCPSCAASVVQLEQLARDLPRLAAIDPGPELLASVLARTSGKRSRSQAVRDFAVACLARPRIAWEGAYVLTFVGTLAFAAPGSPLADVPGRALDLARINPVAEVAEVAEPARGLGSRISEWVDAKWTTAAGEIRTVWAASCSELDRAWEALGETVSGPLGTTTPPDASEGDVDRTSTESER